METDALKRYSAAEVVLLGIFALGLALSLMLVKIRGRVDLDVPVELSPAGLAAPLPKGAYWETAGGWRYESDNAYVLVGRMRARERVAMNVRWRYALCDEPLEPDIFLRQRAESAGGHFEPLGKTPGNISMQYGRIFAPAAGEEFLIGVAVLDFGRRLELHISYLNDSGFAENVFRTLAAAVVYAPPDSLASGAALVQGFSGDRMARHFNSTGPSESAFLIKDTADRPLGYAVHRYFAYDDGDQGHRRITMRQLAASEVYTESDLWLNEADGTFSWTTRTWTPRASQPRIAEFRAEASGRLTLQTDNDRRRILQRTPMMLPEIFLSEFAAELLDAENSEVVVDILTGNGFVVPTRMAKIDPAQSPVRAEQPITIVRAEYLHIDGAFEDFIFDQSGRPLGRFEQEPRRPARLWDAATLRRLQQIFGERFEPRSRQSVRLVRG